jgi:hypothetical protein
VTAAAYVQPDTDTPAIYVTSAKPSETEATMLLRIAFRDYSRRSKRNRRWHAQIQLRRTLGKLSGACIEVWLLKLSDPIGSLLKPHVREERDSDR